MRRKDRIEIACLSNSKSFQTQSLPHFLAVVIMSSSQRSAGAALRRTDDITADLEARLTMEEGGDFLFIHPPSVVSSLAQLSARGSRSGGESFISPPSGRAASLPGSFRGG